MRTPDLFESLLPEAASRELLRAEAADGAKLTPAQQRFNQLLGQLTKARAQLAEWQQAGAEFAHTLQDHLLPAERAATEAQRHCVQVLDALLSDPPRALRLTGRRRARVEAAVLDLCAELLGSAEAADPEVVAIHDRYSSVSHADLESLREEEERSFIEVLASKLGIDDILEGAEPLSTEELGERLEAGIRARAAEAEAAWAEDPVTQRQERTRQRARERAEAKRKVDLQASVRDIYRKLVRDLHPDRETDPVERERKTSLMQRINQAYEAGDLLTLLELQFQLEQLDPAKLAQLSAERLKHYSAVLREQLKTVREQQQMEIARIHAEWGLPDHLHPRTPGELQRWLRQQVDLHVQTAHRFRQTAERLQNPHQQRAELDQLIASWAR
ncbi:MAG: J domain-containing protein [Xanthomonadales bacterium]|jgi:hypothetical protein|nr:J domain-containing protein [Xanthomonadales bacterium]